MSTFASLVKILFKYRKKSKTNLLNKSFILNSRKSGVPDLLEVDDLVECPIDRLCMITYLHTVYKVLFLQKQARASKSKTVVADKPIESENPFHKYYDEES